MGEGNGLLLDPSALARLLAPAMGELAAQAAIAEAMAALRIRSAHLDDASVQAILGYVSSAGGAVATAAHRASVTLRSRAGQRLAATMPLATASSEARTATSAALSAQPAPRLWNEDSGVHRRVSATTLVRKSDLVLLLAHALGNEEATRVIERSILALGLVDPMNKPAAMEVLEHAAQDPGLAGVTARFARARLMMK